MSFGKREMLAAMDVGDVVYGIADGAKGKLLLVYGIDGDIVLARHVTTQTVVEFGRDGRSRRCEGGGACTIVSVAPLPADWRRGVLGLDRKMREAGADVRLTQAERELLLGIGAFFKARPLPPD